MAELFRWGILSTAKIGRTTVLPALADSENGVIHGIASRDADRAANLAARFGAPKSYGSYEALLDDPDIDGVYIPLPTSQHIDWTLKSIAAGKHVLCEKPIALKADQIEAVIKARDASGLTVSEAFMVYYHPQWAKLRSLLADGAIGDLRRVSGAFSYFNIDPANMRNQVELGGGALPDIGVYPIVTTLMATGGTAGAITATIDRSPEFGTDTYASAQVNFGTFDLHFYVSTQMALHQSMVFHGSTGVIQMTAPFNPNSYDSATVLLNNQGYNERHTFRFHAEPQYKLQAEAFVRACRGEDAEVFPLEMSRQVQSIIDGIYAAAE